MDRQGLVDSDYVDDYYINYIETSFSLCHTKTPKIYLLEDIEVRKANIGLRGVV